MDIMVCFRRRHVLGQRFMVDLIVEIDLKEAGITDNLEESISYVDLYQVCKKLLKENHLS